MNADPNSGYRCLVAGDDMRYSQWHGNSYGDRQDVSMYGRSALAAENTLCWADPGPGCEAVIGAAVVCKGPREWPGHGRAGAVTMALPCMQDSLRSSSKCDTSSS